MLTVFICIHVAMMTKVNN